MSCQPAESPSASCGSMKIMSSVKVNACIVMTSRESDVVFSLSYYLCVVHSPFSEE